MLVNDTVVFSGEEILDDIKSNLERFEGYTFNDLIEDLNSYNTYIFDTSKACNALANFVNNATLDRTTTDISRGAFGAIEVVKEYEQSNYMEVTTDLTDPEEVATKLEKIRESNLFNMILDDCSLTLNDKIDDETQKLVLDDIEEFRKYGF